MTTLSGALGAINSFSAVRNWSIEDTQEARAAVHSASRRGTTRTKGPRSWKGSASFYGITPPAMPGDFISFIGYAGPTTGVLGSNGMRYSGTVIVESISMNWNWASNDDISGTINFVGTGPLVGPVDGAVITDASTPVLYTPCGTTVSYGGIVVPAVTQASLNITAAIIRSINSSTFSGGFCWAAHRSSGIIDWNASITQEDDGGVALGTAIGANGVLLLPGSSSTNWSLTYGHYVSNTGITVDPETGAIVGRTLNISMSGFDGATVGAIRLPGAGADWWPFV